MNSIALNKNITIIHILLGEIPNWFYFFLQSCTYNPNIQFIIFTDNDKLDYKTKNIKIIRLSKNELLQLISNETGFKINFIDPKKICDFRPAFGLIFKDYLSTSDYWGYCDNDIILGNMLQYLLSPIIKKCDIISVYNTHLSGPFGKGV